MMGNLYTALLLISICASGISSVHSEETYRKMTFKDFELDGRQLAENNVRFQSKVSHESRI